MLKILLLILAQISYAFAVTTYEIKNLPSSSYLFSDINAHISPEKIKDLQLAAHSRTDELAELVKKYPGKYEPRFFRMDVLKFQMLDVGQMILKKNEKIPPDKIRTFPGGDYLIVNFEGPGSEIDKTFRRIPELLKEAGVNAESAVITYYKKSALNALSEKIQILIKLEERFFVNGCMVFTREGKLRERFPGSFCKFLSDGSFVSMNNESLRMFSSKNDVLWEVKGNFHHQMNISQDEKLIFAFKDELRETQGEKFLEGTLMVISREGKILAEKKLSEFMGLNKKWPVAPFIKNAKASMEVSHLNSVYEIPQNSSTLPYLKPGNIIVNSLNLGAMIFDSELKQNLKTIQLPSSVNHTVHDVQVTADGKILYFNNSLKTSPKLAAPELFDPESQVTTSLVADKEKKLTSPNCGSVQFVSHELMMYAGNFSGPLFADRKSGKLIKQAPLKGMIQVKGIPTFMIKLEPLSSFFDHRQ
ncbi:MAG: hypothetical protein V4598_12830 [Bdellovibrionota bacterium]